MGMQFEPTKRASEDYIHTTPLLSPATEEGKGLLFAQLHQPGGEACDLADGAQDVIPLFGVLAQIGDAFGLCKQSSDVLLSLRTTMRVGQPGL